MSPPPTSIDGTNITGATIDGQDVQEITVDGQTVFRALPENIVNQYVVSNFTATTWTDSVGSADMTVNGLTASTFSNGEDSVQGDGVNDHGSFAPTELAALETFAIAFTVQFTSGGGNFYGTQTSANLHIHRVATLSGGAFRHILRDNDSNGLLDVRTTAAFDDGSPHAVIINKSGDAAADIDIFVDDMATAQSVSRTDNGFNHANYTRQFDPFLFANNNGGSVSVAQAAQIGAWEMSTEPLTQSERQNFVSRRPEV
jgi:hypothetical protein